MRLLVVALWGVLAIGVGVVAFRTWPFLRDSLNQKLLHKRMDVAERTAKELAAVINDDLRFNGVKFYAWPMDGVVLKFEGFVTNANDLTDLKALVEERRG